MWQHTPYLYWGRLEITKLVECYWSEDLQRILCSSLSCSIILTEVWKTIRYALGNYELYNQPSKEYFVPCWLGKSEDKHWGSWTCSCLALKNQSDHFSLKQKSTSSQAISILWLIQVFLWKQCITSENWLCIFMNYSRIHSVKAMAKLR